MQLKVRIELSPSCELPISYHHILQSTLYSLMGEEPGKRSSLHDGGKTFFKRNYKLFTFGPLKGKYLIDGNRIVFSDSIDLEVRAFDSNVIRNIENNVSECGVRLGDVTYHNVRTEISDTIIDSESILVKMISPVCVYETDPVTKHTYYYAPDSDRFYELIKDNFKRKYMAAVGTEADDEFKIGLYKFNIRDKYITKYKDFFIEGWRGVYKLSGKPEYLNFLYNTGLGAKNSQGFGMFEIV